jgi:prepilin-type processing-associated H-X9-DG protein
MKTKRRAVCFLVASLLGLALSTGCVNTERQLGVVLERVELARGDAIDQSCMSNEKQICLAFMMYMQDYDQTLPLKEEWTDDLMPYIRNEQVFTCPAKPDLAWGYGFNEKLAGLKERKLEGPAQLVLLYESDTGEKNAVGAGETLAAPRHQGGLNFGFADGHVKWSEEAGFKSLRWSPKLDSD